MVAADVVVAALFAVAVAVAVVVAVDVVVVAVFAAAADDAVVVVVMMMVIGVVAGRPLVVGRCLSEADSRGESGLGPRLNSDND